MKVVLFGILHVLILSFIQADEIRSYRVSESDIFRAYSEASESRRVLSHLSEWIGPKVKTPSFVSRFFQEGDTFRDAQKCVALILGVEKIAHEAFYLIKEQLLVVKASA